MPQSPITMPVSISTAFGANFLWKPASEGSLWGIVTVEARISRSPCFLLQGRTHCESAMSGKISPLSLKRRRTDANDGSNGVSSPEMAILEKMSPVVVFAHGAGASSSSDWMIRWKDMLGKVLHAVEVVTFDYPYMAAGKRVPPKAENLVDFHADIVKEAVAKYPGHPLVLAGKSMGSRVSCMVANREDVSASAIVCLGYPLKGVKGAIRDEILVQLTVPIMFVQGSRDALCPLNKLIPVQEKIKPFNALHTVEGGGHCLKVAKKFLQAEGLTQDDAENSAVEAIAVFVAKSLSEG